MKDKPTPRDMLHTVMAMVGASNMPEDRKKEIVKKSAEQLLGLNEEAHSRAITAMEEDLKSMPKIDEVMEADVDCLIIGSSLKVLADKFGIEHVAAHIGTALVKSMGLNPEEVTMAVIGREYASTHAYNDVPETTH